MIGLSLVKHTFKGSMFPDIEANLRLARMCRPNDCSLDLLKAYVRVGHCGGSITPLGSDSSIGSIRPFPPARTPRGPRVDACSACQIWGATRSS